MHVKLFCYLIAFACASLAFAQSQDAAPSDETEEITTEMPASQPVVNNESAQSEVNDGFERFDPSEDISEDLSVPFPVDI